MYLTQAPVVIEASKEGVKFSCSGDIGNGSVTIRSHTNVEKPEQNVEISLTEPVALTFSLKYLVNFCKASNLSTSVKLHLSQEVPLLVEYGLSGTGHLRFYLAPKVRRSSYVFSWAMLISHADRRRGVEHILNSYGNTKRRPYDNGENVTEAMIVFSTVSQKKRDSRFFYVFQIQLVFSGRAKAIELLHTIIDSSTSKICMHSI